MSRLICALLFVLVACLSATAADAGRDARRTPLVEAIEKVRLSVVNIRTDSVVLRRSRDPFFGTGDDSFDRLFEDFFRPRRYTREKVETPLGSGIILDQQGFVLTNEHVVRRATRIRVSLADNTTHDAALLCADPSEDIALLRIESDRKFQPIGLGTSRDLMLGETVIALGNPFGFENSVTNGIISALNREISVGDGGATREYKDLIQTTALINPGNSGGPLLNIHAELIGVNTAVVSGAQGIGFAIPVDHVREVLAQLFANRRVQKAWLGAEVGQASADKPVTVRSVEANSPAARTDVKAGDAITRIGGRPVPDLFAFHHQLALQTPGDRVRLEILRAGRRETVSPVLAERPRLSTRKRFQEMLGMSVQDINPTLRRALGLQVDEGAVISGLTRGGPGADAGLRTGDVIIQIESYRVRNVEEAAEVLEQTRPGQKVYVKVVRGRQWGATRVLVR